MHIDSNNFNLAELHFGLGLLHDFIEVRTVGLDYLHVDEESPIIVICDQRFLVIKVEMTNHAYFEEARKPLEIFLKTNNIAGHISGNTIFIAEDSVSTLNHAGELVYENYERKQKRFLDYIKDFE